MTALDVLVLPARAMTVLPAETGRELPLAFGTADVLASARGTVLSCPAWALPEAERKALAERLRSLAWLVESCVPDEAECRAG
jgi:hypothetical protein